jgi:TolB-like protein/Tfp pilus assembly protein PilF
MAERAVQRRLTTIVSLDVAGYSRLMEADEEGTLAAFQTHRSELIDPAVASHGGHIVKTLGDGLLIEFASVVEAVACSADIQRGMAARNADVGKDDRIEVRIGVNLGDVIAEDGDIHGDGVNMAARLQALAAPGGICISDSVHSEVQGKTALGFADTGEHEVKNIARPVRVWTVELAEGAGRGISPAAAHARRSNFRRVLNVAAMVLLVIAVGALWWRPWERPEAKLPDRPSIAVLPFNNFSGDPAHERLADGITEDIITDLARHKQLFVIARNTMFTYKGKAVRVADVARELGVRYVVEGSIQVDGGAVRVTAQTIDALDETHVWAERYDRPLDSIFAVQDEIRLAIVNALVGYDGRISAATLDTARRKPPESLTAYDKYLLGLEHKHKFTEEDIGKAIRYLEESVALDPEFARAHLGLAWAHNIVAYSFWGDVEQHSRIFREETLKALALDDRDAETYTALMLIRSNEGDLPGARKARDTALELGSGNADVLILVAWNAYGFSDKQESEIHVEYVKRAMRLNPRYPDWYLYALCTVQFFAHQYEDSIATAGMAQRQNFDTLLSAALSHAQLGHEAETRASVEALLAAFPDFSGSGHAEAGGFSGAALDHLRDGAAKASLPW